MINENEDNKAIDRYIVIIEKETNKTKKYLIDDDINLDYFKILNTMYAMSVMDYHV
jgi:hypothetical protein